MGVNELKTIESSPSADAAACDAVRAWLDAFADCVRRVDYEAGKRLFSRDVVGFGTVGVLLEGLDTLVNGQWKRVWGVTTGFRFDYEHLTCGSNGNLAWAAVQWTSWARNREGQTYERRGRATYLLQRIDDRWLAIHTHHSLDPSGVAPDGSTR